MRLANMPTLEGECERRAETIESLRQRVEELCAILENETDISRSAMGMLKEQLAACEKERDDWKKQCKAVTEELADHQIADAENLAVSQHYAQQLREALEECQLNSARPEIIYAITKKALDLPHDTSALDANIKAKLKEKGNQG